MRKRSNKTSPVLPKYCGPAPPTPPLATSISSPSKHRASSSFKWRSKNISAAVVASIVLPKRLLFGGGDDNCNCHPSTRWKRILRFFMQVSILVSFGTLLYNIIQWKTAHGKDVEPIRSEKSSSNSNTVPQNLGTNDSKMFENGKYGTVIGIGADYDLQTYQRFVGSLRKTGYRGNIILGFKRRNLNKHTTATQAAAEGENVYNADIFSYLIKNNATIQNIHVQHCTDSSLNTGGMCLDQLDGWKLSWGNYFLVRKWLKECRDCNDGPVLLVPVQDTTFLKSPFALDLKSNGHVNVHAKVSGLELYETPYSTEHWRTAMFLKQCKGFQWDVPILSSQVIKGDRMSILFYIEAMLEEMRHWKEFKGGSCYSKLHGDEVSIHNYLFYNGNIIATRVHGSPSSPTSSSLSSHYVAFMNHESKHEDVETYNASLIVRLLDEPIDDNDGDSVHSPLHELTTGYFRRKDYTVLLDWTRKHNHG